MCDPLTLSRSHDGGVLAALRAGCEAAMGEIDRRYRPQLRAHAARLLAGTGQDPEDVVQDTLLRAWDTLRLQHSRDANLRGWLHTVTRNRALDVRRAAGRPAAAAPQPADDGDVEQRVLNREALREALAGVRALPPRQREALVHHVLDGRSHADVADRMRISPTASKVLVARARTRLRARRRHAGSDGARVPSGRFGP